LQVPIPLFKWSSISWRLFSLSLFFRLSSLLPVMSIEQIECSASFSDVSPCVRNSRFSPKPPMRFFSFPLFLPFLFFYLTNRFQAGPRGASRKKNPLFVFLVAAGQPSGFPSGSLIFNLQFPLPPGSHHRGLYTPPHKTAQLAFSLSFLFVLSQLLRVGCVSYRWGCSFFLFLSFFILLRPRRNRDVVVRSHVAAPFFP